VSSYRRSNRQTPRLRAAIQNSGTQRKLIVGRFDLTCILLAANTADRILKHQTRSHGETDLPGLCSAHDGGKHESAF
jgi:hypothetical protein